MTISAEERLRTLHGEILNHNNLYFVKNSPVITDAEYDLLFAEYKQLTEQFPKLATELAGSNNVLLPLTAPTGLTTFTFRTPMMSLDKALSKAALYKFIQKLPEGTVLDYEYKLDGLALEATYQAGELTGLKTRYDGSNGEDVIHNIALFDNTLPLKVDAFIPFPEVNVRGEAYLSLDAFTQLNEVVEQQYKTPRSAASGLVRRLKENGDTATEGLMQFNVYYCDQDFGLPTYSQVTAKLTELGFTTPPKASPDAVTLDELPSGVPSDGIVVKVDDIALQRELGERQHNPRWAIAYKFPALTGTAELLGVHWGLSMTGTLTPVAIYTPVVIGGVSNSNATLFNFRTFKQKNLRLGAKLEIVRSGDCIPHISKVLDNGTGRLISAPKECPACGELLMYNGVSSDAVNLYCPNSLTCKGQLVGRITQFLGRSALNVKGIGLVTINHWVNKGVVKRLTDLYTVNGSLLGERFHSLLHSNKQVSLSKFLVGLVLPGVGTVTAKELASTAIRNNTPILELLSNNGLLQQAGVDIGTALMVADYFSEPEKYREVEKLMGFLDIIPEEGEVLTGHRVYLSGNSNISRKEIKALLATQNIELAENFSGKLDALLLGTRYSESKLNTANKRGIGTFTLPTPFNLEKTIEGINHVVKTCSRS